jgi:hypothetical protein
MWKPRILWRRSILRLRSVERRPNLKNWFLNLSDRNPDHGDADQYRGFLGRRNGFEPLTELKVKCRHLEKNSPKTTRLLWWFLFTVCLESRAGGPVSRFVFVSRKQQMRVSSEKIGDGSEKLAFTDLPISIPRLPLGTENKNDLQIGPG